LTNEFGSGIFQNKSSLIIYFLLLTKHLRRNRFFWGKTQISKPACAIVKTHLR